MPFQKGNKLAPGGKRNPPGGRPSKEQAEFKALLLQAIEERAKKKVAQLAEKYVGGALSKQGQRLLMHLVDKVIPNAKIDIEVSGGIRVTRVTARGLKSSCRGV